MFERSRKGETALLIQPHAGGPPDDGAVEEFADLARSAGATVAALLPAERARSANSSTAPSSGGPPAWGWISRAVSPLRERSNMES